MSTYLTNVRFVDLPLHPQLAPGLERSGFDACTPIQALSLPVALAGQDVAGQAQTGTGKTAAFLLALLDRLLRRKSDVPTGGHRVRALVLAPTRELAIQIHKDAEVLAIATNLSLGLVYGGIDYEKQRSLLLAGVDVVIGTPGRVIDYARQKVLGLEHLEVLVLDEADRMFDLGFIKDIRWLLRRMPPAKERLSMLFSATLSFRVLELAYEHMNSPQTLTVETDRIAADAVTQVIYHVEKREKTTVLLNLVRTIQPTRTLIFCNTKREAEKLATGLGRAGYLAEVLSGDVPQKKRQRLITKIARGELPILVATDVAARGLHIPDVTHVFNFDLPQNAEDYVHRIGRTARAGASGDAISLACEEYVYSLTDIEDYLGHRIPTAKLSSELLEDIVWSSLPRVKLPTGSEDEPDNIGAPLKRKRTNMRRRRRPVSSPQSA